LRTVAGNIRIAMSDANRQLQVYKLQMDQLQKRLVEIQKEFKEQTSNDDSKDSN
jgi:uncharacterized membrane protein (DUF106 family)